MFVLLKRRYFDVNGRYNVTNKLLMETLCHHLLGIVLLVPMNTYYPKFRMTSELLFSLLGIVGAGSLIIH